MARPSSSYMQEAPPGYRWKTVTKMNAMGRPYTTRILVPIVGPETTSQVLAGMAGQEDRLGALVGADRVPPQDVTTVIKEYEDDTPNTRTTTIKGGLLGEPDGGYPGAGFISGERDWDGSAAFADRDVGMGAGRIQLGDPRNVRAGPDLPPGYAPNPAYAPPGSSPSMRAEYPPRKMSHAEAMAAVQGPIVINGQQVNPEEHVGVGSIASRLGLSSRLAQMQARNRAAYAAQKDAAKKAALLASGVGAAEYARRGIFRGEGEQGVAPRAYTDPGTEHYLPDTPGNAALNAIEQANIDAAWKTSDKTGVGTPVDIAKGVAADRRLIDAANRAGVSATPLLTEQTRVEEHQKTLPRVDRISPDEAAQAIIGSHPSTAGTTYPTAHGGDLPSVDRVAPFRPSGTMGRGGISQDIGKLPTGKDSEANDKIERGNNPNLEKIWGKYAYDPKARRKFYLDNLKDIWRKALLMDVVANLTGGQSMSKRYLEMATGRLEQMEKFNEEERISNIWREVFTDANGNFYMPKTKREAAERAGKTGARPAVIKDIFGSVPDVKKRDQYFRVDPEDSTKWDIKRFDSDPGDEWVRGQPSARSPVDDKSTYQMRNLKHWKELQKSDPELAKSFARSANLIDRERGITPSKWAGIIAQDIANDRIMLPEGMTGTEFIQKFLTQDEVEYLDSEQNKKTMPGYSKWAGQQASKDEVESAVKESGGVDTTTTADGDVTVDTSGEETREEYEARVRKRYPNASEEDIQATVRAKYG